MLKVAMGMLVLLVSALCALRVTEAQVPPPCICTQEFAPVCAGGKTFSNACVATCAGYKPGDWVEGECEPCICTKEFKPVCSEGKTYSNACLAKCDGRKTWVDGACGDSCVCTEEFKPVCSEGKTYSNVCFAKCAGRKTWVDGECGKGPKCGCPKILRPVCAKGKKTFDNSCVAECNGYLSYTNGECKLPPIQCDPGASIAKCRDVCAESDSPCANSPLVSCVVNPCSSATYLGTKLKKNLQCKPIYVNKATRKVVKNCNRPLPPLVCAPGTPQARCIGDPCELTTATCKGDERYVCLASSCTELTYLGTKLTEAACTAIFVDPLKRKVVKECIANQGAKQGAAV